MVVVVVVVSFGWSGVGRVIVLLVVVVVVVEEKASFNTSICVSIRHWIVCFNR